MKDTLKTNQPPLRDDAVYKDVVVIGNGPSGMVTSFLLAGNVPRLRAVPPELPIDEMLRARLSCLPPGQNLLETDLLELAEGLEGRSHNPVPLLMDSLLRPCADLGIQADSLIEWEHDEDKRVSHVVLGRAAPGGSWHGFGADIRSLSPAAWLALPPHAAAAAPPHARLTAAQFAAYCRRYVTSCRLQRYFRSGVVVTSVRVDRRRPRLYTVTGHSLSTGATFRYVCRRVVLACGSGDRPGGAALPRALPRGLAVPVDTAPRAHPEGAVLVVGSGVSAADAVIAARGTAAAGEAGEAAAGNGPVHVYHVHRKAAPALAALDANVYPDYHQVYKMMCDGPSGNYDNYTSCPNHVIVDVAYEDPPQGHTQTRLKRVTLLDPATRAVKHITVAHIEVLVGSRPDLFFLQTNIQYNSSKEICHKCTEEEKNKQNQTCFFSNHWQNLKTVLGQTVQICKSKYLHSGEINGNNDSKCDIDKCNKINKNKCKCDQLIMKESEKCQCLPYKSINECICEKELLSDGIGFGVDPTKPVDGRSNPMAIDKSTHELLNAPKGMYALGPITGDNFIRFIPGGALAIVAHIHRQMKQDA